MSSLCPLEKHWPGLEVLSDLFGPAQSIASLSLEEEGFQPQRQRVGIPAAGSPILCPPAVPSCKSAVLGGGCRWPDTCHCILSLSV